MFGNIRSRISLAIAAVIVGVQSLAVRFNNNITMPAQRGDFIPPAAPRKRGFRTGIKSTNNTEYGAGLREHFRKVRCAPLYRKQVAA